MKKLLLIPFLLLTVLSMAACGDADDAVPPRQPETPQLPAEPGDGDDEDDPMNANLTIEVGGATFSATLENNAAARAFAAQLPMTVNMGELNGNEKYYYLNGNLPTAASRPGTIRTGDLLLYGSNCLVLFYQTFSSSYSYTPIGRIGNPSGLAAAVGVGSVTVTFGQ